MLLQSCWLNNLVTALLTWYNTIGKITVLFNHVWTYCIHLGESTGVIRVYFRTCKTRLGTTTKFMIVVTSLFNLVILSFTDNMFHHVWTWLLIYHDGSDNVVQVCSFIKPWTVCSNMHQQACQQQCTSWPVPPCSSLSTGKYRLFVFTCVECK